MNDIQGIIKRLEDLKSKRILVQYPEGLTLKIIDISKILEDNGFEVILCMEPSYGGCDLRDTEALRLGCDAILHIGHCDFGIKSELPVVYWEYMIDIDPIPFLQKEFHKLKPYKKIGLLTSLQYVKCMEIVKKYLEENGKEVFYQKTLKYPGQILGCCVYPAESIQDIVDCFLYVGTGKFYPLGVAIKVEKPVLSLDLEKGEIIDLEEDKKIWMKKKAWYDEQIKDAKNVGIIVSWKKGQNRIEEAIKVKKELEKNGKNVNILAFDRFDRTKIEGLKFDVLINMVCPRLDDDLLF